MSDGIRVSLKGAPEVAAMLKRVRNVPRMGGLPEAIAASYMERVELRYTLKTDPNGSKWADILPSTKATLMHRASLSGDGSVPGSLLDRNNPGLRSSLTRAQISGNWWVGFSRPYALYHEFGTRYMVRRGLLLGDPNTGEFGAADLQAMLDAGEKYLRQALGI